MEHIRHFFEPMDKACMKARGVDLDTYEGVKVNALRTYFRVRSTGDDVMPPEPDRRWSEARIETFYNWMKNDYPRGAAKPVPIANEAELERAACVRKDIASLEGEELELLKQAFRGLMARDPDDPNSYFALAGIHWLPGPKVYCRHHENAYNPWHRAYLRRFEDALRSVEGCETVSLPYWDITAEPPAVLYEEPFASYTIPRELKPLQGDPYPAGYVTRRSAAADIAKQVAERKIADNIQNALGHSHWERFNGWDGGRTQDGIIRAHDNGHNACGLTMQNQDIAAFDPLFWLFHCNWDRLWWKWQQHFEVMTLERFKTTLAGPSDWLDDPVLNDLPPFYESTADTIDLRESKVTYVHPGEEVDTEASELVAGHMAAAKSFSIQQTRRASIRVKNINRLAIPGSFDISLLSDDKVIGVQGFFQATNPKQCKTCLKKGLINADFVVDVDDLQGNIHTEIHLLGRNEKRLRFPLSAAGDPSLNVRLLLNE